MTSTFPDFSFVRATARFSSGLLLLAWLGACGDSTEAPAASANENNELVVPGLQTTQPVGGAPLGVIVDLDSSQLPSYLPETAKLYVYLRNPGERMPLAVEQYSLSEIPASVVFNADEAMARVEVVARISPLGKVEKMADDLEITAITSITHPQQRLTLTLGSTAQFSSGGGATPAPVVAQSQPKVLRVSVDYTGTDVLSPDLTVFIVAHAPGVAMPLAVKKLTMADLPADVTLTDADSMLPSNNLSSAANIEISAHVSVAGRIQKTSGNWVGRASIDAAQANNAYEIHINEKIE
jgi:hypothetical protein